MPSDWLRAEMVCESIDHGNNVMMAYLFSFLSQLIFQETSREMDVKNHQCYCKNKNEEQQ